MRPSLRIWIALCVGLTAGILDAKVTPTHEVEALCARLASLGRVGDFVKVASDDCAQAAALLRYELLPRLRYPQRAPGRRPEPAAAFAPCFAASWFAETCITACWTQKSEIATRAVRECEKVRYAVPPYAKRQDSGFAVQMQARGFVFDPFTWHLVEVAGFVWVQCCG